MMSILKNFVNPWESGGFGSEVLNNDILNNNSLQENRHVNSQTIIPIAYLFADNPNSVTNRDLRKIKNEILIIYKKNNITIDIKITTKEYIKEKQENVLKQYELAIGVVFKAEFKGNSYFPETMGKYFDTLIIYYNNEYLKTYVSYEFYYQKGNLLYYPLGFHAAHELLHQMIIKASCLIHGVKVKEGDKIYHRMVVNSDQFEIHANEEPNLNLDANLFDDFNVSVPNYRPISSKPSRVESILPKHLDLINFWLAPRTNNLPPPLDYYLNK